MKKIFIGVLVVVILVMGVSLISHYVSPRTQNLSVGGEITTSTNVGTALPTPQVLKLLQAVPIGGEVSSQSWPTVWQVIMFFLPAALSVGILVYIGFLVYKLACKPMPKKKHKR